MGTYSRELIREEKKDKQQVTFNMRCEEAGRTREVLNLFDLAGGISSFVLTLWDRQVAERNMRRRYFIKAVNME